MRRLKDQLRDQREYDQTDITFISWDERHHGDSARLNEGRLSENYSMTDNALDTKQVIDTFDLKTPKYDHFIGVGHSLGACTLLLCEYFFPGTFNGFCLIEPVVYATIKDGVSSSHLVVKTLKNRTEEWEDVEKFRKSLLSKNIYKSFHPEAFELYARFGSYKTADRTIRLKCTKRSEEMIFRNSFTETYLCSKSIQQLAVPTQFLMTTKSVFTTSESMNAISRYNSNMLRSHVAKGTHLLPYEQPDVVIPFLMNLINRAATTEKDLLKGMI